VGPSKALRALSTPTIQTLYELEKHMNNNTRSNKPPIIISIFIFCFCVLVSLIIFNSGDNLDKFDYILIFGFPVVLPIFVYFVVRYHDPSASD